MSLKYLSTPTKILADSITSAAMSFRLNNITGWDGEPLTSGDFGTQAYGVFRNASKTQIELFEYDPATIANPTITILRRGLKFDGDLTTEVAGNKKAWNKGDTQVDLGTDLPQMFQYLQEYIDGIAIAGVPNASTSTKGIGRVSVAPVSPTTPIFVGDNDPRMLTENQKAAAAGGGAFGVPSASNKFVTEEALSNPAYRVPTQQIFTSSGTWNKPANLKYARIQVQARGGSGDSSGAGSGGGGYAESLLPSSAISDPQTVTLGAVGSPTSFGSLVSANSGANASSGTPGTGGSVIAGQIQIPGQNGQNGQVFSASSSSHTIYDGGDGGDSHLGSGGKGTRHSGSSGSWVSNNNEKAPIGYGAGGAASNGVGGVPIVIVTEYYV